MYILVACEESQRVCEAFRKRGHTAFSCDILEPSGGHPEWHIQADVIPLLNGNCAFTTLDGVEHYQDGNWDMIVAFPPCTHLCNSGQRWFTEGRKPLSLQRQAISFFYKFVMADCKKIVIENPVGIMSTAYRKPDQIINPFEFGETECKNTCLWLKGVLPLVPTEIIPKENRTNNLWKGIYNGKSHLWNDKETAKARSKTFPGIAQAMAEQWG